MNLAPFVTFHIFSEGFCPKLIIKPAARKVVEAVGGKTVVQDQVDIPSVYLLLFTAIGILISLC